MRFRRGNVVGWIGFGLIAMGRSCYAARAFPRPNWNPQPQAAPVPGKRPGTAVGSRQSDHGAPGFRVTLFAAEPDVVQPIAMTIDHGAALGRRELLVSDLAGRAEGQGPHPDLRGRRRRRPLRPPDGLLRQGDQLHGHRAGLRRGLGLRHAQPDLHPRPRRRRPARRPPDRQARRLGYQGAA